MSRRTLIKKAAAILLFCVLAFACTEKYLDMPETDIKEPVDENGYVINNSDDEEKQPELGEVLSMYERLSEEDAITDMVFDESSCKIVLNDALHFGPEEKLSVCMGCIMSEGAAKTLIFPSYKNMSFECQDSDIAFAFERDREGRALFVKENKFFYMGADGVLHESDYSEKNDSRGARFDYPSYYGVQTLQNIGVLNYSAKSGYKKTGEEEYFSKYGYTKKAYNFREGLGCIVNGENRLCFVNTLLQTEIGGSTKAIYGPDKSDESAIGYYYFENGLTRARLLEFSKSGDLLNEEEIMLKANGKRLILPRDYNIISYSCGRILLENNGKRGYMTPSGKWICDPDFSDAAPYSEGLAAVKDSNGKYGIIDMDANYIIPCVFDDISNCSSGVICAYDANTGWYVFNKICKN